MFSRVNLPSRVLLGLASFALGSGIASAGTITSFGTISGPSAGYALTIFAPVAPNNDNSPASPNNLTNQVIFAGVGFFDIEYIVTNSAGTTEYSVNETITNTTGVNWNQYNVELGFGIGRSFQQSGLVDFLDFDTPERDPAPTSTAFASLSHGANHLQWTNGVIANGGSGVFLFSFDVPDYSQEIPAGAEIRNQAGAITGYRFTLRQYPVAVPEPATMLLLATGLAGLVHGRRARQ